MIRISCLHGAGIATQLTPLAHLRIRVFREYPYLYDGSLDYEQTYLQRYLNSPRSIAVLAWDNEQLIGASTGMPLMDEVAEFQQPFSDAQWPMPDLFYCAESVLLPQYRGRGIYRDFFRLREQHAIALACTQSVFCAVVRPQNHPLCPQDYQPLDSVWQRFGYTRLEGVTTHFSWQDIQQADETAKRMQFYGKPLL